MRNWYTLPFTLLLVVVGFRTVLAQESISIQWNPSQIRYPSTAQIGKTNVQICNLELGGTYSIIVAQGDNSPDLEFQWLVRNNMPFQSNPEAPHQVIITPNSSCVTLELKAISRDKAGAVPVSLSIGRIDEVKPPEEPAYDPDQPELVNLSTTTGTAASTLINTVLIGGNCFDVTNVTSAGNATSRGTFSNGSTNIGLDQGMVLCTGSVGILPGPNNAGNVNGGYSLVPTPDPDLAALAGGATLYDLSKIEFDFRPTAPTVSFDFVFGSDEYCEFVDQGFNDVFGFFISGPGIPGTQNIAVIPSTSTPVTIDNVSDVTNSVYFVSNSNTCATPPTNTAECQLDGWTSVFTAVANVIPCSTYHIKLAIADAGDAAYASAVFLRANSFSAGGIANAAVVYPTSAQFVLEGCNQGSIRITRAAGSIGVDEEVTFTISGTATPGVDYAPIVGPIIIPAGQTSILIPINVFADGILEGNETIILSLSNSCSCTQTQVTFNIQDLQPLTVNLNDFNGCGSTNTTLTPSVTGATPPLTYQWSNGATSSTLNVAAVGTNTYTVTVTDACGRTSTDEATVTLAPAPTATLSGSGVFCVGSSTPVNLNLNLTGQGDWTVTYNAAGTPVTTTFTSSPAVITATAGGTYSLVSVVSQNGCTGTVSGNVNLATVNVNLNLTPVNPSCFGQTNGSISATPSGGTAPYTYAWTPSGSGSNPTNLGPGTYSVTVTSSQGCTEEATVTLVEPPLLDVTANTPATINCFTPSSSIDLTVNGGTPGYTYTWTGGLSGQNPNVTMGGTYTVTVRDARNCTSTATVTVTADNAQPTAVIAPPVQLNCNTLTQTLDGSASSQGTDFSYNWSGPGITCCGNTLQPTINAGGTYILTVTNTTNGCTKTASVTVQNNSAPPAANATAPFNIGCNHTTVTISGAGSATGAGITYQWSTTDGNIQGSSTGQNVVVNQAGTYTLVVTNNNTGCTAEDNVTITGDTQPPTAMVNPALQITCSTPVIQLDGTGSSQGPPGYTYSWSGGTITGGGTTLTPSVSAGGTYTLVVTNPSNACTATATVSVTANNTLPTAAVAPPAQITCATLSLSLNGNASSQGSEYQYNWSGPGITCCSNTLTPTVNVAGTYTLTVTNTNNGCTRTVSVNVQNNNAPPAVNATAPFNIGCNHPTVTLSGAGSATGAGITYQWSTTDGNIQGSSTGLNAVVNQAGTYTLVVTNNNTGCTAQDVVTITGDTQTPTALVAPAGPVNCFNPIIQLDGTGSSQGAPGYTYSWSGGTITGGGNTLTPSISAGGTYTLTVTNPTNSCTATASVMVTASFTQPNAVATAPGGINCQNATVTLNGNGSSTGPNFSYQWTTANGNILSGDNTLSPVVNQGGIYTLVVTNSSNGCTKSVSVNVTQDQSVPVASAGPDRVLNCFTPTLQLQGSGSIGPSYTLSWSANPGNISGGGNTMSPTVNQPGTYTLMITNTSTGCTSSDAVVVTSDFAVPTAQILPPSVLTCFNPTIQLDGSNSSTGANFQYTWSTVTGGQITGPNNQITATASAVGTYRLVVRNGDNGCTAQAQVTVSSNMAHPVAEAGPAGTITCQNPTATLNGAGSSTGAIYTYQWSTSTGEIESGANTLTPVVNLPGIYTLVVTNTQNGCTSQDFANVTTNQNLPVAVAGPDLQRTCTMSTLNINGSNSTVGPGIQYLWTANPGNILSGSTTMTPFINQAGVYTLQVTNTNTGCTDTDEVVVTNNIVNPVPALATPDVINCFHPVVGLDATGSTQLGTPVYQWATSNGTIFSGATTATPQVTAPGLYLLTITNSQNSCTATAQVNVTQDVTPPVAAAAVDDIISCQNAQVQLDGAGSSVGNQYQYQWSGPANGLVTGDQTLTPTVNLGGNYMLMVSSTLNGCRDSASVTVQSSQEFPTVNAGPEQTLTCSVDELSLNGSGTSLGNEFAYIWDTQDGFIVSGASTLQPLINLPGTYNLSVINQINGCTATASVIVDTDYTPPAVAVAPGGVLSCTVSSVTLNGTGSSSGSQYTYDWLTQNGNIVSGDSTLQPVVNAVGAYTLLVTNTSNGCTSTATTSVAADASLPIANAGPPDTLTCSVNSVVLNASASSQGTDYTYTWAGPGNIASYTGLQPSVTLAGDYSLTVTNQVNGCSALSNVSIHEDRNAPVAEAGITQELTCVTTSIVLDGNGSSTGPLFQYVWTALNGGQITQDGNTLAPTIDEPGLYRLSITNSYNGCVAIDSVSITEDIAHPTVDAGPPSTLTCVVPSATLTGQGSVGALFVYDWSTSDGNIASGDSTLSPVVDAPGTYSLVVTNSYNGCSSTDFVLIDRDANVPNAEAEVTGELNCVVHSLQLDGQNSTQGSTLVYSWTTLDGNITSGDSTLTPVIDEPGQYTLQVYNTANSCVALSSVTVLENLTAPNALAGNPQVLSCTHPVLTLDGNGSSTGAQFHYNWNTDDGNILLGDTTLQPQVDQSGYYTLLVTDHSNGCTAESTVQVLLDQNTPEADPGDAPTLTCAITSVALDGTESSTGPQFSYLWTTQDGQIISGDSTLTPVVGAPGTYNLLITNVNNGCVSDESVLVMEDVTPPDANAGYESTLTCTNQTTDLNITGSSTGAQYSYQWSTNNGTIDGDPNTPDPAVSNPGDYLLTVLNNLTGCSSTASINVPEDVAVPAAAAAVSGELTCSVVTLPLSSAGSSTGAQYDYLWTTSNGNIVSGNTTSSPVVNDAGSYQLQVTNNINGCTSTTSVAVNQNVTPPLVDATVNNLLTCAVTQIQLHGTASGGAQGISYAWSGPNVISGGTTATPTIGAVGPYQLTVVDLYNGCSNSDQVTVTGDVTPPTIAIAAPAELNCYVAQTVIPGSGSTGSGFTYVWAGNGIVSGGNTLTPTVNAPGSYSLTITNTLNGCTATQSTSVSQNIQPPLAQAGGAFELTCSIKDGLLNANGSASGTGINYSWATTNGHILSGGNTATPTVNEPGTYLLTVINAQTGCTNTAQVAVTENTNYPSSVNLSRELPKCGGQPGSLVVETVTGGVGPYLYSIDGGNNFVTANEFGGLTPGTYPIVVQDVNGCEYAQTLNFPVPVEPQVTLNPDVTLVFGQDTKLTAALNIPLIQVDTIIWSPSESLTFTSKPNEVIARPFMDTEYTVRIINVDGCEDVAKVIVRVKDPQIWAPNVFSPYNKDGKSDYFLIFAADQTINKIHSLQVYDRWGTMLFQRTDMLPNDEELGWDGTFRGKPMNPAVFVWWADVELADGRHIVLKGDVTVAD